MKYTNITPQAFKSKQRKPFYGNEFGNEFLNITLEIQVTRGKITNGP